MKADSVKTIKVIDDYICDFLELIGQVFTLIVMLGVGVSERFIFGILCRGDNKKDESVALGGKG